MILAELDGSFIKVLQVERHNKILGVGGYSLFAALCTSKSDCTEIHPYIILLLCVPPKQDSNTLHTPIGVRSFVDKRLEWAHSKLCIPCSRTPGGTCTPV